MSPPTTLERRSRVPRKNQIRETVKKYQTGFLLAGLASPNDPNATCSLLRAARELEDAGEVLVVKLDPNIVSKNGGPRIVVLPADSDGAFNVTTLVRRFRNMREDSIRT